MKSTKTTMRPDTKRAKQKRETRKRILDSAERLFYEQGFFETSPTDIAKDAEVAYGSVYAHFETKGEILTVLHMRFLDEKFERAKDLKRDGRSALEHAIHIINVLWDEDTGEVLGNFIAFLSYIWVNGKKENLLEPAEIYKPFVGLIVTLLQEAQDKGEIPETTDVHMALEIIVAIYFDAIRQVWYNADDKEQIKQRFDRAALTVLQVDASVLDKS